jgi:hypothetical protein
VKIFKILGLKNRATGGSIGENTVFIILSKFNTKNLQKSFGTGFLSWFGISLVLGFNCLCST